MLKNHLLISSMCVAMLYSVSYAENVQSESEKKVVPRPLTQPSDLAAVKRRVELLDFLQKAYDTNPELLSARYARNAKEAEMLGVMSRFGPNVKLMATAGHDRSKGVGKNFSEQLESFRDTDYDVKGEVVANINLFRCGSDTFAMMAGAANQDVYDVEQAAVIQKFILDAVEAYVDVKKRRQELDVFTKFERQARHNFERVQTEYVVGSSTRTNVLTAKAELAEATSKRTKAQTELINAEQSYIAMSGEPAGELVYPTNTLRLPISLEESMKLAEERSLTLRKGAASLRAARYGLASAVTDTLPSIDLYAQYDTSLKNEDVNQGGTGQVGIRFSYELFSNSGQGSHLSKIKQATNRKQSANYGHEHARNHMIKEVKAAWHGLKAAETQRSQAELAVEAARNAYEGAVEEFRLGQRAYLDLLKVQEQLLKAELNYLEAVKAEILGRYKLLASTGGLTPSAVGLVLNERDEEV
ncbi:MAG: TolC family protein [Candidatus Paracaedibacteraceae bacterium]|nr:TolC family protein [Candidatus Paracaedibacteraceae bacterium]